MNKIGLIIGRFQPLHVGHHLLIKQSLQDNDHTIILIGSSNLNNNENPYSYELRKSIIQNNFYDDNIDIQPLDDHPDDVQWGKDILSKINSKTNEVTLYFGDQKNDSAVKALKSLQTMFPYPLNFREIPRSIIDISATQVRKWIEQENLTDLKKYLSPETLKTLDL